MHVPPHFEIYIKDPSFSKTPIQTLSHVCLSSADKYEEDSYIMALEVLMRLIHGAASLFVLLGAYQVRTLTIYCVINLLLYRVSQNLRRYFRAKIRGKVYKR